MAVFQKYLAHVGSNSINEPNHWGQSYAHKKLAGIVSDNSAQVHTSSLFTTRIDSIFIFFCVTTNNETPASNK